jgi:hypothetical protein
MSQVNINFLVAWAAVCGLLVVAALVQDWRGCCDRTSSHLRSFCCFVF